ncbi:MAG: esterase, partial [Fluviicola sp.]
LAVTKLKNAKISIEVIVGEKMPHIWPFLPVMKEAKTALKEIITRLNN